MTHEFSYLAAPYSHVDYEIRNLRYKETMKCAIWLFKQRIWAYAPVLHWHEASLTHNLPSTFDFWWPHNQVMLFQSSRLLILALDGWQDSRGIAEETTYAHTLCKPINFIRPLAYEISDD